MTADMAAPIRPEHQGPVVVITINRPGVRAVLSPATYAAIANALDDAGFLEFNSSNGNDDMTTDRRFDGPGPDAQFRAALAAGRFLIQRCSTCGAHRFPPGLVCLACGDAALETVPASGEGTVHSTTVVRRRPEHGGNHNVALIDLAEGPRLMSRVEGVAPEAVRIGMAVRARIAAEAEPVLVFDAVEEQP